MNSPPSRAAVFLDEMGIGPLWTLRSGAGAMLADDDVSADSSAGHTHAAPDARATDAGRAGARVADATGSARDARGADTIDSALTDAADAGSDAADAAWADAATTPPTDADIAAMNWSQLRAAVAACTRCGLCGDGRKPVFGSGAQTAQWAVVAGATSAVDQQQRQAMSGEPGALLGNMLTAAGKSRATDVYVTNLIKGRATRPNGAERAPTADEAAACRPYAEREIALSGATLVLTLGQIAANGLLDKPLAEALSGTRGRVHERAGAPLVATLHPGELLLRGADKAQAWADLCLAMSHDGGR